MRWIILALILPFPVWAQSAYDVTHCATQFEARAKWFERLNAPDATIRWHRTRALYLGQWARLPGPIDPGILRGGRPNQPLLADIDGLSESYLAWREAKGLLKGQPPMCLEDAECAACDALYTHMVRNPD